MRVRASLVVVLALAACEPEQVTPTPTQVCLPFSSGQNIDACASALCVERSTERVVTQSSAPGFVAGSSCPSAALLARDGGSYADYRVDYKYTDGTNTQVSLTFGGELCQRGLSTEALRATLRDVYTAVYPRVATGTAAGGGSVAPGSVEIVSYAAGRLHLRFDASYGTLEASTADFACINSSGNVTVPSSCPCTYAGGGVRFAYHFDLDVPFAPLITY